MELDESSFLTLGDTTKLQSSRQYGTGTKTEIQTNGTDRKDRNKPMHQGYLIFDKGGKNIKQGNNSVVKTGQLRVSE